MYIFTLVTDVERVIENLQRQRGDFTLAMLYNTTLEAESGWNLIVSAPWTDGMRIGEATRLVADALNRGLGLENQRAISRITVLRTSDPFVRDMTTLYPGTRIPLSQVTAGQLSGSGFVFYSRRVAA